MRDFFLYVMRFVEIIVIKVSHSFLLRGSFFYLFSLGCKVSINSKNFEFYNVYHKILLFLWSICKFLFNFFFLLQYSHSQYQENRAFCFQFIKWTGFNKDYVKLFDILGCFHLIIVFKLLSIVIHYKIWYIHYNCRLGKTKQIFVKKKIVTIKELATILNSCCVDHFFQTTFLWNFPGIVFFMYNLKKGMN